MIQLQGASSIRRKECPVEQPAWREWPFVEDHSRFKVTSGEGTKKMSVLISLCCLLLISCYGSRLV